MVLPYRFRNVMNWSPPFYYLPFLLLHVHIIIALLSWWYGKNERAIIWELFYTMLHDDWDLMHNIWILLKQGLVNFSISASHCIISNIWIDSGRRFPTAAQPWSAGPCPIIKQLDHITFSLFRSKLRELGVIHQSHVSHTLVVYNALFTSFLLNINTHTSRSLFFFLVRLKHWWTLVENIRLSFITI